MRLKSKNSWTEPTTHLTLQQASESMAGPRLSQCTQVPNPMLEQRYTLSCCETEPVLQILDNFIWSYCSLYSNSIRVIIFTDSFNSLKKKIYIFNSFDRPSTAVVYTFFECKSIFFSFWFLLDICWEDSPWLVWRWAGSSLWEGGAYLGPQTNDGPIEWPEQGLCLCHVLH